MILNLPGEFFILIRQMCFMDVLILKMKAGYLIKLKISE